MMLSRVCVLLSSCVWLGMVWGCNGIVGVEAPIEQKMVVLPVSPSQCQALYHVPIQAKGAPASLVFPKGASVAELPATVEGDGGA